ncbi:UNVERIFIED_ORG: hypothetical protein [Escherichia phage CMSTMSU]
MNQYNTIPPFITVVQCDGKTFIGIIKIKSKQYTTLYCFDDMDEPMQDELLGIAHDWWWQSNRSIPVCLFFQEEMEKFEPYTQRFDTCGEFRLWSSSFFMICHKTHQAS